MKILPFLVGFILAGCAPVSPAPTSTAEAADVRLTSERVSPAVVRLTLHNDSAGRVGYNLCSSTLQRKSDSTWTRIPTDEVCTMVLMSLEPGRSATFDKSLPAGLSPGQYRYVTSVENPVDVPQTEIATDPFTVG